MLRLTTNLLTLVHGSAFIATVLSKLNRLTYTYTRGGEGGPKSSILFPLPLCHAMKNIFLVTMMDHLSV